MVELPLFSDPSHHPVVKAASNMISARDNQLFVSPMVEGVIVIQNFNVSIIFSPKKTQDILHDPDGSDPILIGAVGSSLTSATPVSVHLKSLFQDFLFLEHNHYWPLSNGYSQSTIIENTRLTSAAMREHDQRRSSDTRDFLHKLISNSEWNNATTALFLNGVLFDSLLDELLFYLQTSISFITFLPIHPASVNPPVQNFLHQINIEHLKALVGESNEKKRKINLRTFQGGLQDTPTHILTGLANFESKLSFMVR